MSDNDDQAQEIDPKIQIGTDVFGDPIITVNLVTPSDSAMSPETAELIALKLMAAAAAARSRAGLMRSMLLDGASDVEARRAADKYLM